MFNDREDDIAIINDLITTTIDSADGYEKSAENVRGTTFERMFSDFALERRQIVGRLQEHVRQIGGKPEDEGSLTAGLHRRFEDLRRAFSGGNDKAVIDEVERGEDHLKAKYQDALRDKSLSPQSRPVISEAYQSVMAGHEKASELKHSLQGA
jgi:uncharacterized protein (TIGR02284 family)